MYLTAQRVRSPRGDSGINVALHAHAGTNLSADTWSLEARALLDRVTTQENGNTIAAQLAIVPGGNSVESFLDVIAPDGTSEGDIEAALGALRSRVAREGRCFLRVGVVVAEFSTDPGTADPVAAFDALSERALALYRNPVEPPWLRTEPLVVEVAHDEEGWAFELEPQSAARVRGAGGHPARVSIRHDVASDFRQMHGPLYSHVAEWVTGLDAERLLELGGARFRDGETLVGVWPKRS